jgi:hypothetical protein
MISYNEYVSIKENVLDTKIEHRLSEFKNGEITTQMIQTAYEKIKKMHSEHLKEHGVKLPKLFLGNNYTQSALVLIFLTIHLGTEVSKKDLTNFIRVFYPETNDVQQARHLGSQSGWNILSGSRGNKIKLNHYMLVNLTEPLPSFDKNKRLTYTGDFDSLKKLYHNKCATCGAEEGKEHPYERGSITKLEKGHMDSSNKLEDGNIIPQCQFCNKTAKNKFVFTNHGRVDRIAVTEDGLKVVKDFIDDCVLKKKNSFLNDLRKYLNERM